jgi:hypothetical protein
MFIKEKKEELYRVAEVEKWRRTKETWWMINIGVWNRNQSYLHFSSTGVMIQNGIFYA